MSVWFSVVASMSFMYMVSTDYDLNTMRIIFAVLYCLNFFGGTFCESKRQDNINNEINELKREIEKIKRGNDI